MLEALLENPQLSEKHLAILLSRRDLPRSIVTQIAQNRERMKSYPLKLAVVKHPHTPRHLALPLLKFLYLFDLMGIATMPGVPPELKRLAEEAILAQREGISLGQRLSLARRGSTRIAAGLLADSNRRVIEAALSNPSLTEPAVAAALRREKASPELTEAVAVHPRWCVCLGVKLALLRSPYLSLRRFMEILPHLPTTDLADLISDAHVAGNIRAYVSRMLKARKARRKPN